jgi:MoaA/NifB/PqqE/SkfB family radical SAM enzyme
MRTPEENTALMTEEHAAGKLVVANLPSHLTIESTSICNLRCVMCPQGIDAVHRPRHMPEQIMDALADATAVVRDAQLHGIGEPLASPVFWRALESHAFHPDAQLSVNTNLTLLNDRRMAILTGVRAKLTLNVSLDAATERTYRRIRGADFNEVTANIGRLRAARGERRNPTITMNMTLMRENIEEAPAFVELAHRLGADGVCLWQLNQWPRRYMARYRIDRDDWHFDYAEQGLWNYPELSDRYMRAAVRRGEELGIPVYLDSSKESFFDDSDLVPGEIAPPAKGTPAESAATETAASAESAANPAKPEAPAVETIKDCRFPWERAMITSDGEVRPCCYATGTVGSLNESSFAEIWNGKKMQDLRRDVMADRINSVCHNAACKFVRNTLASDPGQRVPRLGPSIRALRNTWEKFVVWRRSPTR